MRGRYDILCEDQRMINEIQVLLHATLIESHESIMI
jgi:hypothetical protein